MPLKPPKKNKKSKPKKTIEFKSKAKPIAVGGITSGHISIYPPAPSPGMRYLEAIGRRKTSVARVRFYFPAEAEGMKTDQSAETAMRINQKPLERYFPTQELRHIVAEPFARSGLSPNFSVWVKVRGGGIHSQAEAVRHGISRALERHSPELRKILKPLGFLKRDPRMKERRKFGLKKARRAPQWSKR